MAAKSGLQKWPQKWPPIPSVHCGRQYACLWTDSRKCCVLWIAVDVSHRMIGSDMLPGPRDVTVTSSMTSQTCPKPCKWQHQLRVRDVKTRVRTVQTENPAWAKRLWNGFHVRIQMHGARQRLTRIECSVAVLTPKRKSNLIAGIGGG